jgi:guanylate kinase
MRSTSQGRLFVLSGPSGVGKDTVLERLHVILPDIKRCVTATTRTPRSNEVHGRDYLFYSFEEFRKTVEEDGFLEHARVNGNLYGTPKAWVQAERAQGHDVLLKIDVQGGLNVRRMLPEAILIFLEPPSPEDLEKRLRHRGTESEEQLILRLMDARNEMEQRDLYDYAVLNDVGDVESAAQYVRAIILAERVRIVHTSSHDNA